MGIEIAHDSVHLHLQTGYEPNTFIQDELAADDGVADQEEVEDIQVVCGNFRCARFLAVWAWLDSMLVGEEVEDIQVVCGDCRCARFLAV